MSVDSAALLTLPPTPSAAADRRRRNPALTLLLALVLSMAGIAGVSAVTAAPAQATVVFNPAGTVVGYALGKIGVPYVAGATGPYGFDCSGLTGAAYRSAGITLPRVSRDQYNAGPHYSRPYWQPGDLIFWAYNTSSASTIHHVAIYAGAGMAIEAPHTGLRVQLVPVYSSGLMFYSTRPIARYTSRQLLNVAHGWNGGNVLALQWRMRSVGYLSVTPNGVYDATTYAAVTRMQRVLGWAPNGAVGSVIWGFLLVHGQHYTRV